MLKRIEIFENRVYILYLIVLISSIYFSFYSSILALYYIICLFAIFPHFFKFKVFRIPFAILAIVNASIMVSSRSYFLSKSDDFSHYYESYVDILNGAGIFEKQYAGGLEFFLNIYFKIIGFFFGNVSIPHLLFLVSFLCSILFYIGVEKLLIKKFDTSLHPLIVASAFLFFPFLLTTQLMRQMIASGFLLIALSYSFNCFKGKFFLLLATISHSTSLVLYFLYKVLFFGEKKSKWIISGVLLFISLLSFGFFNFIVGLSLPLVGDIFSKANYYLNKEDLNFWNDSLLKYAIIMILMYPFFGYKKDRYIVELFYFSMFCYMILLPLASLSSRFFLVTNSFLLGFFVFLSFYRIKKLFVLAIIFYAVFRFFYFGPLFIADNNGFDLWSSYGWKTGILDFVQLK